MTTRDLKSNIDAEQSLAPAARTASANGTGVDLRGHDSALALISIGAYTDGEYSFKLQESDDDGVSDAYADVAAADLQGSFSAVNDASGQNALQRVGYAGTKRFIRAVVTEGGSPTPSTGLVLGANIVRGNPHGAALA